MFFPFKTQFKIFIHALVWNVIIWPYIASRRGKLRNIIPIYFRYPKKKKKTLVPSPPKSSILLFWRKREWIFGDN
jgi:hypothetical protein